MLSTKNIRQLLLSGIAVSTLLLTAAFVDNSRYFELIKNISLYAEVYKTLNDDYVDNIEPAATMRKGIEAMLKTLDPYTNYLTSADIETYRLEQNETMGYIGATVISYNDAIYLSDVSEDLPAFKAGLRAGNRIVAVAGEPIGKRTANEVKKALQGQTDTDISITVQNNDGSNERTVKVMRTREETKAVPHFEMLGDGMGYVKLTTFMRPDCSQEVRDAIEELQKKGDLKGLILDLRNNGGGLLNESVKLVNLFVPNNQVIVRMKGRTEDTQKDYKTEKEPLIPNLPIAILTNDHSASASEITAGSIQDLDRGVVVGQRSFGKGLVQHTRDIGYGNQFKLTIAKYLTPSGRCVQALNYTKRYTDASASSVPDSLRTAYKTKNGRTVFDGSGVEPDVAVEKPTSSNIAKSLVDKYLIFDFANQYKQKHDSIAAPKTFALTDAEYDEFVKFVGDKKFDYNTQTETLIERLNKTTDREQYDQSVKDMVAKLTEQVKAEKKKELYSYKTEIKNLLTQEIIGRYYYQKGKVEASLNKDPEVLAAISTLSNPVKYKQLLTPNNNNNDKGKK
jgi:carboxyl-terminal processing protease